MREHTMSSFLHRRSMAAGLLLCGLVTSLVVPGTGLHRPLQAQEKATAARPDTDADEVDSSEFAGVEDPELAARVFAIFEQRCESCHSEADNSAGLDVTSKLSMFSTGKAISSAPICSGIRKFPKAPASTGMMTRKIITEACMVNSMV